MRRLALAALTVAAACSPAWKQAPHDLRFQRTPALRRHPMPRKNQPAETWDALSQTTFQPLTKVLNPGHYVDRLTGGTFALDINAFGQVMDSPWFSNRIGRRPFSVDEIKRGPNTDDGPADGPLVINGGKIDGATPGLILSDRRGARFVAKFDPAAFPGLASGAEIIATKILWAAGYNVPENHVGSLDLHRLVLSPDATTAGEYGAEVPLDQTRLAALIAHVNPFSDGTARALFSSLLPGDVIGPFHYRGLRGDDPNDRIAHERRRSLRGLRLFNAWVNNVDPRSSNSLDVFIKGDDGLGTVRHYLIDFGDALGSAGTGPKYVGEGYEGLVDWPYILRGLVSLGIWYRDWLGVQRSPYRSVGTFESAVFELNAWRSRLPNPAFEEATILDDYWAASIIARFTPEHLAAIVDTAEYNEPGAREWVLRVLSERQFAILDWVFERVLPLDDPTVDGKRVALTDLAAKSGLIHAECQYRWSIRWNRTGASDQSLEEGGGATPTVSLQDAIVRVRGTNGAAFEKDPFITVRFERLIPAHDGAVEVHLRVIGDRILPVAMERTGG